MVALPPITPGQVPVEHRAGRTRWLRWLGRCFLRLAGFRVVGTFPEVPGAVLAVGPHTSNLDFLVAAAALLALDVRVRFLAKRELFRFPLGACLRALGGVPVDRARPEGLVEALAEHLRREGHFLLAITPEGTRKPVARLKTGYARIARAVPCPVVPVLLDYGRRQLLVLPPRPAADPEADAADLHALFATVRPVRPANFAPPGPNVPAERRPPGDPPPA